MSRIAIIGRFDVHPDDVEQLADLMRAMMEATVKEPGCNHYAFSRDLVTPNRFQLSELWEDDASLDSHSRTPHMATFRAGLAKLRVQDRTVRRYRVIDFTDL